MYSLFVKPFRLHMMMKMFIAERSHHCVRHPYIRRAGDMGYRHRIHPGRRIEEIGKVLGRRRAEECEELAVSRGVMAPIRDQAPKEGPPTYRGPAQALLAVRQFPFPLVSPHGVLPLISCDD